MKKEILKRTAAMTMASMMVLSLAACGGQDKEEGGNGGSTANVPAINDITLGEDYQDIKADIKIPVSYTHLLQGKRPVYPEPGRFSGQ